MLRDAIRQISKRPRSPAHSRASWMRAGWPCPCFFLAVLVLYVIGSLFLLHPPLDPVGSANDSGIQLTSSSGIDSIVFIALGSAARSASLLYALSSLREEGNWHGSVHVVVDREEDLDCLSSFLRSSVTPIVASQGQESEVSAAGASGQSAGVVATAKMAKMRLLDLLPASVERVLYVDCDIIAQRPLGSLLGLVARQWADVDRQAQARRQSASRPRPAVTVSNGAAVAGGRGPESVSTILIFPDRGGHTIPACSGCDTAHSGIVGLARGHSEGCLDLWREAFVGDGLGSTGTATDQEALDLALRKGTGCEARYLDRHHMHFMKDPFVIFGVTRTSTFGHFTGLLHPDRLSALHWASYERLLGRSREEWGRGVFQACAGD